MKIDQYFVEFTKMKGLQMTLPKSWVLLLRHLPKRILALIFYHSFNFLRILVFLRIAIWGIPADFISWVLARVVLQTQNGWCILLNSCTRPFQILWSTNIWMSFCKIENVISAYEASFVLEILQQSFLVALVLRRWFWVIILQLKPQLLIIKSAVCTTLQ